MSGRDGTCSEREADYISRIIGRRTDKQSLPEPIFNALREIERKNNCCCEYVKIGTDLTFNPSLSTSIVF